MKKFFMGQTVRIKHCSSESGPVPCMYNMIGEIHTITHVFDDGCCYTVGGYSWIWKDLEGADIYKSPEDISILVDKSPKTFDIKNLVE